MHHPDRLLLSHLIPALRLSPIWICLLLAIGAWTVVCPAAAAQSSELPALRLGSVLLGGLRATATESWNTFDVEITNPSDTDRHARVFLFFPDQPDVQFGRDVWVPARATIKTWLLAGPHKAQPSDTSCEIVALLYEHSGDKDRLFLPTKERPLISRRVLYRPRELTTAILLDDDPREPPAYGDLPPPESPWEEGFRLALALRAASNASEVVREVRPGAMPLTDEAFDGIDQFILASDRISRDPAGLLVLRRWVQQGGRLWVMLDRVGPSIPALLLGDALDFQVVDRVGLNSVRLDRNATTPDDYAQQLERPVDFVRVVLPQEEHPPHVINGWPAWFTRRLGRGKIIFTALGPRAWHRPRTSKDRPSPFPKYLDLPAPLPHLEMIAYEMQPLPAEDESRRESFERLLNDEIGYSVVSHGTVASVFGGSLLAALLLGIVVGKSRAPSLLGWLIPAAALGAAATFLVLGELSLRAVPPTVAVVQLVDASPGIEESALHGRLATYRPDAGTAEVGVTQGGFFDLDMTGIQGQTRRLLMTDSEAWHWDNLDLPAGVRLGSFHYTATTTEPIAAAARFGTDGLQGKLNAGNFRDPEDAVLHVPPGRTLAVRLRPDGTFTAGSQDALPKGQYLSGTLLSDRQQRRQDIYREFLKNPTAELLEGRPLLFVWAKPVDMHFALAPNSRLTGSALLVVPLRLERPASGERVTIPGAFVTYRQIARLGAMQPVKESSQALDMRLRFQLPTVALPFKVEQARLVIKIDAPSRRVVVSGEADGKPVELHRVESPLDPIRVTLGEERLLHLDNQGGLYVNLSISDMVNGRDKQMDATLVEEKWRIEDISLEVTGRAE
jgi:hypothetical protein